MQLSVASGPIEILGLGRAVTTPSDDRSSGRATEAEKPSPGKFVYFYLKDIKCDMQKLSRAVIHFCSAVDA
jgi:hypothetical protein